MRKILITGGSGFIGTNLIERLLPEKDIILLNIDRKEPKIEGHNAFWKQIDLCDKEELTKAVVGFHPNYIIHLAARTDLRGSTIEDYSANTDGVKNLLEAISKTPELIRVIFSSSMYVCRPGYQPTSFDDYTPHTTYGQSKVMTEKLIKESDCPYTWSIIRPTSIWGPYFGEPYDKFFKLVMQKRYFHLGEKACKKTYGYVDNTVYQIISIMNAKAEVVNEKVFYLGDYEPYDITEWANEIAMCLNIKIPTIPFFFFRMGAWLGNIMSLFGIKFPMTSFRLKNMTTDNIHDMKLIQAIAPELPVSRINGTIKTINWLASKNGK